MEVVGTADNGADALALIGELKPDVLLLDLVLSKLDGLELLRRLGEVERRPQVIVLSGFVNGKVVGECSALGADYFISKPCDPASLLIRIRPIAPSPLVRPSTRLLWKHTSLPSTVLCTSVSMAHVPKRPAASKAGMEFSGSSELAPR